ncbi:machado-joseph disease [Cyclospora cayetanensis]|uniref:ubiquitinyl hydrolase 1 n=1 Tax=Cyclospora cayetanensis TaxID=88456 RepID=A0A1D3D4S3_9EIME|nr:machado-joseph disease [Cyclospora cayetanensis]
MAGRQRGQLVYWEKQGADRMCALHCLNSVLQGPYFTESELSAIGLELDKKERQLMAEGGVQSEDYQAFLAEGSGNVAADGYFNVSVLIECLRRKRIHCICQKDVGEHEEPGIDFGYILNHADHWLALRRVHGMWYNLDSMKPAPTVISTFHLAAFLSSLTGQGYTVFVVRPEVGDLPAPGVMQTRSNNQFYLTQKEIDERHKQAAEQAVKDAEDAQRVASGLNNTSGNTFLAKVPRGKEPHVWPEGQGYRLNNAGSLSQPTGTEDTLEDPELQEAIRLSMECYRKEFAKPTEEPSIDEDGVKTIFVRTPSGKRLSRRFREDDTLKQVCNWIVSESHDLEGVQPLSSLSSFSLVQTFPR